MANLGQGGRDAAHDLPFAAIPGNGVCMMRSSWKDEQHPSFIQFISSFLSSNSYRLNFLPIAPDFIFNNGGQSVAFVFVTSWISETMNHIFSRILKLKGQFKHLYIIVSVPTREQNDSFVRSYFKNGMEFGKPVFVFVQDLEMGFEKIVKIAHVYGVLRRTDAVSKLRIEHKILKREKSVENIDTFVKVITSIPGINKHDANVLFQAIGSIEAISKASKSHIVENTDISGHKAETIVRFFKDSNYCFRPKII
ncbi:protein PARTING DANCERS homolog [Aristolochia californica]|uniref:protein PARTING DANCERS homolog n=1 Tax=Aristolochia californica TaxID=171875 RepID=UPI0035D61F4A